MKSANSRKVSHPVNRPMALEQLSAAQAEELQFHLAGAQRGVNSQRAA